MAALWNIIFIWFLKVEHKTSKKIMLVKDASNYFSIFLQGYVSTLPLGVVRWESLRGIRYTKNYARCRGYRGD